MDSHITATTQGRWGGKRALAFMGAPIATIALPSTPAENGRIVFGWIRGDAIDADPEGHH